MKLSIVTINYNDAIGLENTIQSVINQSYKDFEYIIIDGGSTDGSLDIIKKYADRINYWISESDKGIYNAMNKGIRAAKGEHINFLNSRDVLIDNDVLKDIFSDNSYSEYTVLRGHQVNDYGTHLEEMDNLRDKRISIYDLLLYGLKHQATFIKREAFDKYGLYNENLKIASDLEFFIKVYLATEKDKYINRKIVLFNKEGISSDPKFRAQINEEKKIIIRKYFPPAVEQVFCDFYAYELENSGKQNTFEENIADFIAENNLPRFIFRVINKAYRILKIS